MDDRVLREMNVVSLHAGPVRLESNTAIITRDGVFVADQGVALDVRGWPADHRTDALGLGSGTVVIEH